LNTIGKLYSGLLLKRMTEWIEQEGKISEFQAGFRANYSAVDNIFNLFSLIELKLSVKRTKVYSFFVDLSATFDSVDRRALIYKLHQMGMPSKIVTSIKSMLSGTVAKVRARDGLSHSFSVKEGVRQGCLLSPTLFSLYINDLEEELRGGVSIGNGRRVNVLAYADDIVLLADTPTSLQMMINELHHYCSTWNLKVNLEKSKVIVFRNGGRPAKNEKWRINGRTIEVTNMYKYLGVLLTPSLSMSQHIKDQVSRSKLGLNTIWHKLVMREDLGFDTKEKVFKAVSRSILWYGAQVWGGTMHEEAEKLLRFFY